MPLFPGSREPPVCRRRPIVVAKDSITVGLDTWVEQLEVSGDRRSISATLRVTREGPAAALVTLDGRDLAVCIDGVPVSVVSQVEGCVAVSLPAIGTYRLTAAAKP